MESSIKFSSAFEIFAESKEEALILKAKAELIGMIRDMEARNSWSQIEVCA
ncbi:hypothetical protein V6259_18645 [Marinomonas sp. TI.3.20]|uniref:hypothetical protein n=1 Tax=Marinomonas sp. TI.3.20 TaxID=3121296 RepID=UPI00311EF26F